MKTTLPSGGFWALSALLVLMPFSDWAGPNYSLSLNAAADEYVLVPASLNLPPATNAATAITLEAWVNVPSAQTGTILSRGDGGNGSLTDYIFQLSNDGGSAGLELSFYGVGAWDVSASSIPVNTWTHVAVSFDGVNKYFYINGALNKTAARAGSLYATNSALYIGRQGSTCDCNFFTGQMAEVRVWNTVRTASQISADMNASATGPQAGLVAYYHLNEGGGTTVYDATGNGHTGTLENSATWNSSIPPALGATNLLVGPTTGSNSVVLRSSTAWAATANAAWLHLSAANQTGLTSTNVVFSFDANTGSTRTGTLTIAGLTLTVTQAGSTYVATAPLTSLISSGLEGPSGMGVDGAGNVYIADYDALLEWSPTGNNVTTLAARGTIFPVGAAVDGVGNVYMTDESITFEWVAASNTLVQVPVSGLAEPSGLAVDNAANIYVSDLYHNFTVEWSRGSSSTSTLASFLNAPSGVAVDVAGNVYIVGQGVSQTVNEIYEWIAANNTLTTLPISGLHYPQAVAVDGSGNLFISDYGNGLIKEWSPATQTVATLAASEAPAVAVDGAGNLYLGTSAQNETPVVAERQQAFVDPTPKPESAGPGTDALPIVLPATANLLAPFAPTSSQSWLTITSVTNRVVSFAFTFNTGAPRTAYISLLGQSIPINQAAAANAGVLGTANRLEAPNAGADSVVLVSPNSTWTATANASWLQLSATSQFGVSSSNVVFSFTANTGATRTGTLTIAGQTLTVTQAGTNYISATGPLTALATNLNGPAGIAVDGSGNVYFADSTNNAIKEWLAASDTVNTLVSSGLNHPFGVALDASGDVYFADSGNNAIKEWSASGQTVTTLVSSNLSAPAGVAVDAAGNVYFADSGNNAIKEWSATSHAVATLVSSGLSHPMGVSVDAAGNVYIADTTNNAVKQWAVASNTVTTLVSSGLSRPDSVDVDGAGNVYIADTGNSAIKLWSTASNTVSTLVSSGVNHPFGVTVDAADNIYISDTLDNAVKEQPRAFLDPTAKVESPASGADALSVVLPATENLLAPFAPTSSQSWLAISGVNNGLVDFAFTLNTGATRLASITLLGQTVQVTQAGGVTGTLATSNRVEGSGTGLDSVLLASSGTWVATANASWLHLSGPNQSGAGNANVIFSFDANAGPPRAGTLTIAGQTLTVSQAGANYVAASASMTVVPNLNASAVALDGAGNVYFAANNEIEEWSAATYIETPLVTNGLSEPSGVAVDQSGNVYIADTLNGAIKEWSATSHAVTTLATNGVSLPEGLALDGAGNVYFADEGDNAIKEWVAASNTVTTLVSSGLDSPGGVALDFLGNVYFADTEHSALKEWSVATRAVTTLSAGVSYPYGIAVDGAGNVYIANNDGSTIGEWIAASNTLATFSSSWNNSYGVALDTSGNVFVASYGIFGLRELPHAYLLPTNKPEGFGAGTDVLPAVVPGTENLSGPLAPVSNQPWLTIAAISNGIVNFAFSASTSNRTGIITLLGQNFPVTQYAYLLNTNMLVVGPGAGSNSASLTVNPTANQSWTASSQAPWLHLAVTSGSGNAVVNFTYDLNTGPIRSGTLTIAGQTLLVVQEAFALGSSTRLEGNLSLTDSVVLASLNSPWSATANAPWLHLSATNQSGLGSTNVFFSVDANTNATRVGTLTIAGITLSVTQAGATYIPAPAPLTTLVSADVLSYPYGLAVDSLGNVYIADIDNGAIYEWLVASNTTITLPITTFTPAAVALDGAGNVYVADGGSLAVYEWSPASNTTTTLPFVGLSFPTGLAVDVLSNVYVADYYNNSIYEWSPLNGTVTTLISNSTLSPGGVAVDIGGNVYFSDDNAGAVFKWSVASNTVSRLVAGLNNPGGVRVDGAGNVYVADFYNNAIKMWSAATLTVTTLVSSGLNAPQDVAVDVMGNVYIANGDATVDELPRAFIDPTAKTETAAGGSDSLPVVLPATEDLLAPFAPTASQPWLTISGITNGVVTFAFSVNNTGIARTAGIALLGGSIPVTQSNVPAISMLLTGAAILPNGSFQFTFANTPGATFTVLTSTNLLLPVKQWTPVGAPVESPAGQYTFTASAATNTQSFYTVISP